MKSKKLLSVLFLLIIPNSTVQSQFWKKLKDKANEIVNKKIDETVDGAINKNKKENSKKTSSKKHREINNSTPEKSTPLNIWRDFKFIPGEKVIFYDNLLFEETGEFPSRWDLMNGGAEIASINNEKVILFLNPYNNYITPLFKNSNYLGDEFTAEFDFYINKSNELLGRSTLNIMFEKKYIFNRNTNIEINISNTDGEITGSLNNFSLEEIKLNGFNKWHHCAISYYKGKLKLYIDEYRILNLPNFKDKIEVFALSISSSNKKKTLAIKNIRIAHGGGQMYKRITADGKYVTNGISFDSGKTTIKPESMGIINKMVAVMKEKSDWKFKIIGHTDSVGNNADNLNLSKQRAKAVKAAIVNAGISANRLTTDGKGEEAPLNTNSTKEEKANNRRVEFIKL